MRFSSKQIRSIYEKLVCLAQKSIDKSDAEQAAFHLTSAAHVAYDFNFIYTDKRCEDAIGHIAKIALADKTKQFKANSCRVVFYDTFSWNNRGLTQQYIRALMALDYEFLYIFGSGKDLKHGSDIISELEAYDKVTMWELNQNMSCEQQICDIYNLLVNYAPSHALLHIAPWSVVPLAVLSELPEITSYNINLTDHAFWLGSSIVNYNIEFRDYGASVSAQKRAMSADRLLMLPYYPIVSDNEFQGFPEIANGRTVIFSGGSVYKVYGQNGIYFDMVKRILDENPDAVLLFAGDGNMKPFKKFIKQNEFEQRIALLGNRSDINQVFKNADLYLGTYPFTGGLMSQYAAVNGLAIVAYTDPKFAINYVEGIVCHNTQAHITYDELEPFFARVQALCSSADERQMAGKELSQCVIEQQQFTDELKNIIENRHSNRTLDVDLPINYDAFHDLYVETEADFLQQFGFFLICRYRLRAALLFPMVFLMTIPRAIRAVWSKVVKKYV